MKKTVFLLAAGVVLAAMAAFVTTQVRSADPREPKRAEEAAVRQATADFIKKVETGDAKGVAASWTEEGEYIGEDGTAIRGRADIEAAYDKALAKKKNIKVEFNVESIRFPSKDTAIEEGYAKRYRDNSDQPTCSRYSVLHVREGGKWLMALLASGPMKACRCAISTGSSAPGRRRPMMPRCARPTNGRQEELDPLPDRDQGQGPERYRDADPAEGPTHGQPALVDVRRRRRLRRRRLVARRQALGH